MVMSLWIVMTEWAAMRRWLEGSVVDSIRRWVAPPANNEPGRRG